MIRVVSSLLLALMLALTSQSMAVARGASAATGKMVLCTGSGPVAVYMDAQGEPTSAPHICPDAAMNVLLGGGPDPAAAPWAPLTVVPMKTPAATAGFASPRTRPYTRAPPLSV